MSHRTVKDVMTTTVRIVYAGTPVKLIAEQLDFAGISAMPVLDDEADVVGVVSETDLLHKITYQDERDEWPRLLRRHRTDRAKAEGLVARDLMTAPAITIDADASVVDAARLMEKRDVKRLPVVNDTGKLLGIVSRGDLVRLFVRSDAQIRDEVEAEVFGRVLLHPPDVAAEVTDGVVTLSGTLPRRSDVELAVEFARRIDGVVRVVDALAHVDDDTSYRALREQVSYPSGPFL
ncbi:CBS domain-containing protein [Cryptosporangium arvum]|uniref:CBS-domain-containing membrane protein n=1 Tax=Cryptosporangium arvum DSM 44712 TaxID=927661 RepID=A0A010ZZ15_9ACTN|nr:CBS domain-containing protein [Cryptosporangium arvum]EXG82457.1 CBS-domain-containing membrane protein [Cryptosporangium arvum DSM 44712]